MAFPFLGFHCKCQTNEVLFLMERNVERIDHELAINITISSDASSSSSPHDRLSSVFVQHHRDDQPSTSSRNPVYQPPHLTASISNSRNSSLIQRGNSRGRQRSPLNSGLWICVELVLTVGQIIAAIVTLSLSTREKPQAPLRTWIIAYAAGCMASLLHLYWRFKYLNQGLEHDSSLDSQDSSSQNNSTDSLNNRITERENNQPTDTGARATQNVPSMRLKVFVAYLKTVLDCFFAVWFVVGSVWIFGRHSSSTEAPNLYRLCIVFLTFSCIGYAMPFILCTMVCCCLPCIISILGNREDLTQNRGTTQESINSLPTYKFKMKKNKDIKDMETNSSSGDVGIVAAGTDRERAISGEDAVCCICLATYVNNDELMELPCFHFFHKVCVDKWLKINSSCPLCKADVGETPISS